MLSAHDTNIAKAMGFLNFTDYTCITELFETGKTSALSCELLPSYAS